MRVADDDLVGKYLLLSNSHDGRGSVRVKFTPIRFACWNSLMLPSSSGNRIRVRHTSRVREQMALATVNLGIIQNGFARIEESLQALAKARMNEERLAEYLGEVFPDPADPADGRALKFVHKARTQSRYLFENGNGNTAGPARGTLWAAYNGVTEFVDHVSTVSNTPDLHLDSIWFGRGCYTKARAYRLAVGKAHYWMN